MRLAWFSHPDCALHEMGRGHPESPARLDAAGAAVATGLERRPAPEATREQLLRVHDAAYLDALFDAKPESGYVQLDPDTVMNPHTLSAARHAAGAAVAAVDLVMAGGADHAFCAVRPPGHHACRARAMGFCLFNNVAVGAAHALEAHGLERVAIVDFDVHHGNGTEDIFRGDPRVMMASTFQHPFYPHSGVEGRSARMVNVPLAARTGGDALRTAVEQYWAPALESFRPRAILVSAGFDAHADDGMAGLEWRDGDYAWLGAWIAAAAGRYTGGRAVSLLEGGYDLPALERSVAAYLEGWEAGVTA